MSIRRKRRRPAIAAVLAAVGIAAAVAQETPVTLYSGEFEDLMIAADPETRLLTGYYFSARGSGTCRLFLRGPLRPTVLYQRSDVGEGYEVELWDPKRPDRRFSAEIFSVAKRGFAAQLILSANHSELSPACRDAESFSAGYGAALNRWNWVSNSYVAVRVVRARRATLYALERVDGALRPVRQRVAPPKAGSGVWVANTYSPEYSPAGYVNIAWYVDGKPYGGYVREDDLYPLPEISAAAP